MGRARGNYPRNFTCCAICGDVAPDKVCCGFKADLSIVRESTRAYELATHYLCAHCCGGALYTVNFATDGPNPLRVRPGL